MSERMDAQMERITRYENLIARAAGRVVRPYRADGYVNMMTKYGTQKDASEQYRFVREPTVPDELLVSMYEGNGLFAKIINAPAEEALKSGFELEGIGDEKLIKFYAQALDELDWTETAISAIEWARLFGGSLAVLLVNDGGGLDEPLNWRKIKSIDDIRIYDRSIITPDYGSMYFYNPSNPFDTRGSRLGEPEYYDITSKYGSFRVHESRCLIFRNGKLPENTTNSEYELWGIPEYVRIHRQLRDVEVAYGSGPKMLDRSVQPVYQMSNLSNELSAEGGEDKVLRRIQAVDMARGMMNTIVIDKDGEDYGFRTFSFAGTSDLINTSCNVLSAVTNIPQTVLFGRSPAGENATGHGDMENYYNYVQRIQQRMLRTNLRYLLSIIFQAGLATGEVEEIPEINVKFKPLWSLSDAEQADLDLKHAQLDASKAATIRQYVDMQVLDPSEVRKKLAEDGDYDICTLLDDIDEETLNATYEQMQEQQATENEEAPAAAPDATKLPQDMDAEAQIETTKNADEADADANKPLTKPTEAAPASTTPNTNKNKNHGSVGVIVVSEGEILTGTRHNDFGYGLICGPGGHIEAEETPEQAAVRETQEEFGITPKGLMKIGRGPKEPDTGLEPYIFLCTDYDGEPKCDDLEMVAPHFRTMQELEDLKPSLFQPFADEVELLKRLFGPHNGGGEPARHDSEDTAASLTNAMQKTSALRQKLHAKSQNRLSNGGNSGIIKVPTNNMDAAVSGENWITLPNGVHVPLNGEGKAAGGPVKGMDLSGVKPETEKTEKSEVPDKGEKNNSGNGKYTEAEMAEIDAKIQQDIKDGKYKLDVDKKKQSVHIKGSAEYEKRLASGRYPSYLTISEKEAGKLVKMYAGTGEVEHIRNYPDQIVERVKSDRKIGYYLTKTGESAETSAFKIHYSKNGVHIVPDKE